MASTPCRPATIAEDDVPLTREYEEFDVIAANPVKQAGRAGQALSWPTA
jgi:hypothetical protein